MPQPADDGAGDGGWWAGGGGGLEGLVDDVGGLRGLRLIQGARDTTSGEGGHPGGVRGEGVPSEMASQSIYSTAKSKLQHLPLRPGIVSRISKRDMQHWVITIPHYSCCLHPYMCPPMLSGLYNTLCPMKHHSSAACIRLSGLLSSAQSRVKVSPDSA